MKIRNFAILALALGLSAPALAQTNPATGEVLPTPANRLVGSWESKVALGACNGGPAFVQFTGYNTFHHGGTVSDTNNTPSALRSAGHGAWRYSGGTHQARFKLFRFLPDGRFDGHADVQQTIVLDRNGRTFTSEVRATNYNPDGSFRATLCGSAQGTKMAI